MTDIFITDEMLPPLKMELTGTDKFGSASFTRWHEATCEDYGREITYTAQNTMSFRVGSVIPLGTIEIESKRSEWTITEIHTDHVLFAGLGEAIRLDVGSCIVNRLGQFLV